MPTRRVLPSPRVTLPEPPAASSVETSPTMSSGAAGPQAVRSVAPPMLSVVRPASLMNERRETPWWRGLPMAVPSWSTVFPRTQPSKVVRTLAD